MVDRDGYRVAYVAKFKKKGISNALIYTAKSIFSRRDEVIVQYSAFVFVCSQSLANKQ